MATIRRLYIYLICAISLQATAWALVFLLRGLLVSEIGAPDLERAFQMAVILVGLPVYVGHWAWARRLVQGSPDERTAGLRHLYLHGMMAGFLAPLLANAYDLLGSFLQASGTLDRHFQVCSWDCEDFSLSGQVVYHLIPILVLGLLWEYHRRTAAADASPSLLAGLGGAVRRLYIFGFSAVGLIVTAIGAIDLLRWIVLFAGWQRSAARWGEYTPLRDILAHTLIGLPLWLVFWLWAQRLFNGPQEEERDSTLRKLYLYAAIFIGTLVVVGNTAAILASLFRRLLGLAPEGELSDVLPQLIVLGVVWAYHAYVLRQDADRMAEAGAAFSARQAGVRRLYLYLVAAVGLTVLLIGAGGMISVVLRSFDRSFGDALRVQLAWFSAAVLAGLPVWLLTWRQAQGHAAQRGPEGGEERQSLVRKIYLYAFLLAATLTVLGCAIYVVYQILASALGAVTLSLSALGQAIAYGLIGALVWLYHIAALRGDGELARQDQAAQLADFPVLLLDLPASSLGPAVQAALQHELPGLQVRLLTVTPDMPDGEGDGMSLELLPDVGEGAPPDALPGAAEGALAQDAGAAPTPGEAASLAGPSQTSLPLPASTSISSALPGARLVILPAALLFSPQGGPANLLSTLLASSPARKLLLPTPVSGWEWAGLDRWSQEALARQAARAVEQIIKDQPVSAVRPLSISTLILLGLGLLLGFGILMGVIGSVLSEVL